MKKLHLINAVGVLLLAILGFLQWRENGELRRQVALGKNEQQRLLELSSGLEADKKALSEDLASFRSQLSASNSSSKEKQQKLRQLEDEKTQVSDTLADLRQQVKTWQAASAERDSRNADLMKNQELLLAERDKVAALYRNLCSRLEETQKLLNERTELYNQVVEKLNAKP